MNYKRFVVIGAIALALSAFTIPVHSYAQAPTQGGIGNPTTPTQSGVGNPGGGSLFNPLGSTDLMTFLKNILAFVVKIGTVVVVLMLVYVGFMFATAQGEPGKISAAREALLWTVVGALILLGAQAIASGIQATAQALSTGP